MHKIIGFGLLGIFTLLSLSCKSGPKIDSSAFRVGLVLDRGGIDDKSFNASAYRGALKAKNELGVEVREVEATDEAQLEPTFKSFAKGKFNLVIGVGFVQREALERAAKAFPGTQFAIVDAVVDQPNVSSLMFQEHEGSYLAGALAAMKSKSGVLGFVGGMDIPLTRRFLLGYQEGARKINPSVKVIENFVGTTGDAWNNPTKAKELALAQLRQKADIIYHVAGASGLGVFDAVDEASRSGNNQVYAIGVDSNQNDVKPGRILTSMMKRVDQAVFDTIKKSKESQFQAGKRFFGLQASAIDLAFDKFNEPLIDQKMKDRVEILKQEIIDSKIKVSDFYLVGKP